MRAFLALRVSEEVEKNCVNTINQLRTAGFEASWTKSGNFHLTLAFLGEQTQAFIDQFIRELRERLRFAFFDLETERAGFFSKRGQPSVVWVGLKKSLYYNALCETINDVLGKFDFERINPKQNHITLGRVKTMPVSWKTFIEGIQFPRIVFPVNEVVLYQSVLSPQGAVYSVIETFNVSC